MQRTTKVYKPYFLKRISQTWNFACCVVAKSIATPYRVVQKWMCFLRIYFRKICPLAGSSLKTRKSVEKLQFSSYPTNSPYKISPRALTRIRFHQDAHFYCSMLHFSAHIVQKISHRSRSRDMRVQKILYMHAVFFF